MRWTSRAAWCAACIAAFCAGVVAGRSGWIPGLPQPAEPPREGARPVAGDAAGSSGRERELEAALEGTWLTALRLAARVDSLEALLAELTEGGHDLHQLVANAVARLSDRELRSILASAARLPPEALDEVRDLPGFATRLAEVAMEDIVAPGEPEGDGHGVLFTDTPDWTDPAVQARGSFSSGAGRIYAVFPTAGYARDAVMMKWYRSDPPRILLFERYPIRPGDAYGYVWLQPRQGWEPGEYHVDVFAADEAVTRLARGRYTVVP